MPKTVVLAARRCHFTILGASPRRWPADNSPAIYGWVNCPANLRVPAGRQRTWWPSERTFRP
jgi:hypothetical protein